MPYYPSVDAGPVTVVETREFSREAAAILSSGEVEELKFYLACNPLAGVVIRETGGVRKLRWGAKGKGKRGGARVIYYFHNEALPLFLVTIYGKGAKQNIARADIAGYRKLAESLLKNYRRGG